jgi:hypothetical protein
VGEELGTHVQLSVVDDVDSVREWGASGEENVTVFQSVHFVLSPQRKHLVKFELPQQLVGSESDVKRVPIQDIFELVNIKPL